MWGVYGIPGSERKVLRLVIVRYTDRPKGVRMAFGPAFDIPRLWSLVAVAEVTLQYNRSFNF